MKALSLHGAWAHYDRQNAGNAARIAELEAEASRWREEAQQLRLALEQSEQQCAHLQRHELPSVQEENTRARCIISQLETEVQAARDASAAALAGRDAQLAELHAKVAQLTADNNTLKQELAKNLQVRTSTHSKLDEARRRLGLTASEAQVFVKEFDEACRSNAQLRKEVAQLQNERSELAQQCENRSQHCMTLIAENKRLADQIAELRRQTVELDQEGWKLRQQITAAATRQQHLQRKREAAVTAVKERPSWQSSNVSVPTAKGSNISQKSVSTKQTPPTLPAAWASAPAAPFTDVTNVGSSGSGMEGSPLPGPSLRPALRVLAHHSYMP